MPAMEPPFVEAVLWETVRDRVGVALNDNRLHGLFGILEELLGERRNNHKKKKGRSGDRRLVKVRYPYGSPIAKRGTILRPETDTPELKTLVEADWEHGAIGLVLRNWAEI